MGSASREQWQEREKGSDEEKRYCKNVKKVVT